MEILLLALIVALFGFIFWLVSEFHELVSASKKQVKQNKEIILLLQKLNDIDKDRKDIDI